MPTSNRKVYDEELLQLDSMLARMGHAAGGAISSAMQALREGDLERGAQRCGARQRDQLGRT